MAAGYGRGGRSAELQNAVTSEAGKGPLAFRRIGPREIPRPAARGAQSDLPGAPWSKWGHPPLQFANVSAPPFDFTFVLFFQNIITTSPVIHSSSAFHALTTHKTTSESSREAHTQSLHTIGFAYIAGMFLIPVETPRPTALPSIQLSQHTAVARWPPFSNLLPS